MSMSFSREDIRQQYPNITTIWLHGWKIAPIKIDLPWSFLTTAIPKIKLCLPNSPHGDISIEIIQVRMPPG